MGLPPCRPRSRRPSSRWTLGGVFQLALVTMVLTLLLVMLLDTAGTLIGVARQAGFLDKDGRLPRLRQALLADSGGAMLGAALGTSTTTAYIESAAGVEEGGRTGLPRSSSLRCFSRACSWRRSPRPCRLTPRRRRSSSSPA